MISSGIQVLIVKRSWFTSTPSVHQNSVCKQIPCYLRSIRSLYWLTCLTLLEVTRWQGPKRSRAKLSRYTVCLYCPRSRLNLYFFQALCMLQLKRSYELFSGNQGQSIPADEDAQRLKLSIKIKDDFAAAHHVVAPTAAAASAARGPASGQPIPMQDMEE